MSHSAPFRQRPNLYLALAQSTGSPRAANRSPLPRTPSSTAIPTPVDTPLAGTSYSPLRSSTPKFASAYSSHVSLPSRGLARSKYEKQRLWQGKRVVSSRLTLILISLVGLLCWWLNGGRKELKAVRVSVSDVGRDLLLQRRMQDYRFYPATNPKIHYMGRWTATPNHLRKDGTFPGVYFDVTIKNTTSLLISLHNAPADKAVTSKEPVNPRSVQVVPNPGHLSFRPLPADHKPASPVSLLIRVDDEEYVLLPNASVLVQVAINSLSPNEEHQIRVIAPMTDDGGKGVVEMEGLWLSKGGSLEKVEGSTLDEEFEDKDLLVAEDDHIGGKHRASLSQLDHGGTNRFSHSHRHHESEEDLLRANRERRKVVEIVTDSPGSFTRRKDQHTERAYGLLGGVMGWEYLLGDMFSVDHVCIGVDGMCLTQECIGSTGFPAGIGDAFFRSGPYGSDYFEHSWVFTGYIPDLLVLNIGESDAFSFEEHQEEYNKTLWDLTETFESTYVSLIKGIRRLGYSKHPAIIQSERLGSPGIIPHGVPVSIPIFVMRPLRGHLEQATQNVVDKLRSEGDRSVYWLDTSGWLDVASTEDDASGDFYLDEDTSPSKLRLTEQGNQRVAIFLHTHVCQYLARQGDKCAFLPQEVYRGTNYDAQEADFDHYLETQKEQKLKDLFWEGSGYDDV